VGEIQNFYSAKFIYYSDNLNCEALRAKTKLF
jgi:hypothetical protein